MKKKMIIASTIVVVLGIVMTYVLLNANPKAKIAKSLNSETQFYVFGYDNKTEMMNLNAKVSVDELEWNPESIAVVLDTQMGPVTAIYDGLEAKLQFIEVVGEDGVIVSHFVFNNTIKNLETSGLQDYLNKTKITEKEFVDYLNALFVENGLRAKFDAYKSAFAASLTNN